MSCVWDSAGDTKMARAPRKRAAGEQCAVAMLDQGPQSHM